MPTTVRTFGVEALCEDETHHEAERERPGHVHEERPPRPIRGPAGPDHPLDHEPGRGADRPGDRDTDDEPDLVHGYDSPSSGAGSRGANP